MSTTYTSDRRLPNWLAGLEGLKLECDGLSRVVSRILWDAGVTHRLFVGELYDLRQPLPDVSSGQIVHYWIELTPKREEDTLILDLRARMWMGAGAPHGIFTYREAGLFLYEVHNDVTADQLPLGLLCEMAGVDLTTLVNLDDVRATDWDAL